MIDEEAAHPTSTGRDLPPAHLTGHALSKVDALLL